jgi:hypothetical protein
MNRKFVTLLTPLKGLVIVSAVGALAAVSLIDAPAVAQQWVPPPPEFVATAQPEYYEGHAAYWYGNHWYWRDEHGGWNHYDNEPPGLAERRAHAPPVRRSWERGGGRGGEHGGRR